MLRAVVPKGAGGQRKRAPSLVRYLMPALVVQLILAEVPFAVTIWLAFERWNFELFPNRRFDGLGNFRNIIGDGVFVPALENTVELMVVGVVAVVLVGTISAIALNREFLGHRMARTLIMTPFFIPPIAVAFAFREVVYRPTTGLWSYFLGPLGAPQSVTSSYALPSIGLVEVWEWAPLATLIILSGLQAIPADVREAAQVDGASRLRTIWSLEIPLVRRSILVGAGISAIFIFQSFDAVQIITNGGPGTESMSIALYIYQQVFENFDVGAGEAAGLLMLLSVVIVATLAMTLIKVRARHQKPSLAEAPSVRTLGMLPRERRAAALSQDAEVVRSA